MECSRMMMRQLFAVVPAVLAGFRPSISVAAPAKGFTHSARSGTSSLGSSLTGFPNLHHVRTLFAAAKKAPTIVDHKINFARLAVEANERREKDAPKYEWMKARFIIDRNGVIWRKQANSGKNKLKSRERILYNKRQVPLFNSYAKKIRKLGFNRKFWLDVDPKEVPGFNNGEEVEYKRHKGDVDYGCPALLKHRIRKRDLRVSAKSFAPDAEGRYYRWVLDQGKDM